MPAMKPVFIKAKGIPTIPDPTMALTRLAVPPRTEDFDSLTTATSPVLVVGGVCEQLKEEDFGETDPEIGGDGGVIVLLGSLSDGDEDDERGKRLIIAQETKYR